VLVAQSARCPGEMVQTEFLSTETMLAWTRPPRMTDLSASWTGRFHFGIDYMLSWQLPRSLIIYAARPPPIPIRVDDCGDRWVDYSMHAPSAYTSLFVGFLSAYNRYQERNFCLQGVSILKLLGLFFSRSTIIFVIYEFGRFCIQSQ
jgi:hypothetical protein